ncbi:MAG: ribonuclease BN [Candidatus Omnitrophica bacterium 4484_171]|nr:MAG: ribonuclease BN [Candidatus Omnitrophica bacterium 4484_171]
MVKKVINFVKNDIWRIRLKSLPRRKSFLIKNMRVILVALRGFDEDKCQLRASALTFYSLLSIVPVVAMAFGVAKGFGFDKILEQQLLNRAPGQEEVIKQVISFSNALLSNTKGGLVAGIGVAVLFWTVIKVLGNIEKSFNDIWGIKEQRGLARKFSDYLSIMLICPFLVVISSSATVFIAAQITNIIHKFSFLGVFSGLVFFALKLLPYAVLWLLFTFIYMFMPNTKVNFKSAVLAGIAAGTLYQVLQWAYVNFQIGVARYNAIYGSFAALPLFLVWLQLSWLVVLFGAEVSFAHQNVDTYEFEPDCLRISYSFKRLLALSIAHFIIKSFSSGDTPPTGEAISHALDIPIRLVRQILYELVEAGIIYEIKTKEYKNVAYQPAKDINIFTIKYVMDALDRRGIENIPVTETNTLRALSDSLNNLSNILDKSPANKRLKDL